MFVSELCRDPDDGGRVGSGGICKDLTQVRVVGYLELVLDDHGLTSGLVAADQVETEVPNGLFGSVENQIHSEQVAEHVDVLKQPGCEVERLVGPDCTRLDRGQSA